MLKSRHITVLALLLVVSPCALRADGLPDVEKTPVEEGSDPDPASPPAPAHSIYPDGEAPVAVPEAVAALDQPDFDVTFGVNIIYPQATFHSAFGEQFALSVSPSLFHFAFQGESATFYGGNVGLSAYSDGRFSGFWGQIGVGGYLAQTSYAGIDAQQLAISEIMTAGYRWRLDHLNIGIAGGAQHFDQQKNDKMPFHFSVWWPVVLLDVGWTF